MRLLIFALVLVAAVPRPASAEPAAFTDDELTAGFVATVFGAEVGSGRDLAAAGVVKKFDTPVHFAIVTAGPRRWKRTVRSFLASLSASVEGLTFTETPRTELADMRIYLVRRVEYVPTIRTKVWPGIDTTFLEENACSAVIATRGSRIERALVFLVIDEGFVPFAHCMVEEIAQSLGPANDDDALVHSIFNDTSPLNVLGVFDWFILNMLYDARIQPGMDVDAVLPILPAVIEEVRARLPAVMEGRGAFASHHAIGTRRAVPSGEGHTATKPQP